MPVVKVHCGSAHVSGKMRRYPYYVASLFQEYKSSNGRELYSNAKISTSPRRSMKKAIKDGQELAKQYEAIFISGYGSLHNQPVIS